jgi:hypothetical protein
LIQSGVGLGLPIPDQFWMPVGERLMFFGFESTDHTKIQGGITVLFIDGS